MKTAKGTLSKSSVPKSSSSSIRIKGARRIQFQGSDVKAEKKKYRIPSMIRKASPKASSVTKKRINKNIAIPIPSTNLTTQ